MLNFSQKSLILEYWEFILPILIISISYLFYTKNYGKSNDCLDGAEYIQADYKRECSKENEYENDFQPSLEVKEHVNFPGATITLNGGASNFFKVVNNRRSVRHFSSKSVSIEIIKECIKAAGTGPSGAHTEPWTYCVISNSQLKSKIRETIETEEYLNYSQRMHRQWTTDLRPLKTDHVKKYLTEAPHIILLFKQTYGIRPDGKKKQHYYNEISVSISCGIFLCALQAAGLNSLITTPLNCGPSLRLLLGRPENEKLLVLIPVGYAADDCKVPDLKRKSIEEIFVHFK